MRKVAFEARKTLKSMNKPAIAGGVSADTMFKQGSVMRFRLSGYTKAVCPDFDEFTWRSVMNDLAFKARRMLKKRGGALPPPPPKRLLCMICCLQTDCLRLCLSNVAC